MTALDALERRGDEIEAWHAANEQAQDYMKREGTDTLVEQLRLARDEHRRVKLGTINTLVLLAHIDRLEAALANERVVLP